MLSDQATVLRLLPLGEHGVIAVLCTKKHGVVRAAARQARKAGSDFYGRLDLFYECEIFCASAAKSDLLNMKAVTLLQPRLQLRKNLLKLRLASYMTRLFEATVETLDHDESWHKLLSGGLDYLDEKPPSAAILIHFEKRLAELHGLYLKGRSAYNAMLNHFEHLPAGRGDLLRDLQ